MNRSINISLNFADTLPLARVYVYLYVRVYVCVCVCVIFRIARVHFQYTIFMEMELGEPPIQSAHTRNAHTADFAPQTCWAALCR